MRIAISSDERTPLVDFVLADLGRRGHETVYIGPEVGRT